MERELLFRDECRTIQEAISEVYRVLGGGFLEPVYQECLEKELGRKKVPFEAQRELRLYYKGEVLQHSFRPDLVCYDKIIVELQAVPEFNDEHRSQVLNTLKCTGMRLGLLINFGNYQNVEVEKLVL